MVADRLEPLGLRQAVRHQQLATGGHGLEHCQPLDVVPRRRQHHVALPQQAPVVRGTLLVAPGAERAVLLKQFADAGELRRLAPELLADLMQGKRRPVSTNCCSAARRISGPLPYSQRWFQIKVDLGGGPPLPSAKTLSSSGTGSTRDLHSISAQSPGDTQSGKRFSSFSAPSSKVRRL